MRKTEKNMKIAGKRKVYCKTIYLFGNWNFLSENTFFKKMNKIILILISENKNRKSIEDDLFEIISFQIVVYELLSDKKNRTIFLFQLKNTQKSYEK